MRIGTYPHPALRHKSKPVRRVDKDLRQIVEDMFQLMYDANGVGLAANQVDLPFRLFVVNLAASPSDGEERVFINPVISQPRGNEEQEEGCLSIPGVYAPVKRPKTIHFSAFDLSGNEISGDLDGMLARVVQHETDHLDGVLFVDRLSTSVSMEVESELAEMAAGLETMQEQGHLPPEAEIRQRLTEWEQKYC